MWLVASVLCTVPVTEPDSHALQVVPIAVSTPLGHVGAATALADGRLIISDARTPRVSIVDRVGRVQTIGSPGVGDGKYAEPGGFYQGPDGTILLLDRAGPRVLVIAPTGEFVRSFSAAQRGVQRSSEVDTDRTRLDAAGHAYFTRFTLAPAAMTADLVRLDPLTQRTEILAKLGLPEMHTISGGDGVTFGRSTIGSPADDWGVTPDGRVAVVRAKPYRLDWIAVDGTVVQGPEIPYDRVPYTDADKRAFEAKMRSQPGLSVGRTGEGASVADLPERYAAAKPPFFPDDVVVAPTGQVWVMRAMPFGAATAIYDVFDARGARVDRVQFPATSRIVGFALHALFVREGGDGTPESLREYRWP